MFEALTTNCESHSDDNKNVDMFFYFTKAIYHSHKFELPSTGRLFHDREPYCLNRSCFHLLQPFRYHFDPTSHF